VDTEKLRELIRQPEGLKLDFKSDFYHLDLPDPEARNRQWGELIKDVLAMANGNVNIAGETGHIIFGVGDKIKEDGTREILDVGTIRVDRQQILAKINSFTAPALPDLEFKVLLLDVQRVLVMSIPPTPHIHETTKRIVASRGQSFPENTVFIRRGEGTHVASMAEIQTISAEKQRVFQERVPSESAAAQPSSGSRRPLIDVFVVITCIVFGSVMAFWGYANNGELDSLMTAILGLVIGVIYGFVFAMIMKALHWVIARRPATSKYQLAALWFSILAFAAFGVFVGENTVDSIAGTLVGGPLLGLPFGVLFAGTIWVLDWALEKLRR
jgi:hypothetical protein